MHLGARLTGSVGKGGTNRPTDVLLVQNLINLYLLSPLRWLLVDGVCGPLTIFAIEEIQRRMVGMKHPDGVVGPNSATFRAVASPTNPQISAHPRDLVKLPQIAAMLDVLGFSEGTGTNYGKVVNGLVLKSPYFPELVGKRNVSVTDLSRHPDILVQVSSSLQSTAAGRYQFLFGTWNSLQHSLHLDDFRQESQDIAAVQLMKQAQMIKPLLAGNLNDAINNGATTWASLPATTGASYYGGQPAVSVDQIRAVYSNAMKSYQ